MLCVIRRLVFRLLNNRVHFQFVVLIALSAVFNNHSVAFLADAKIEVKDSNGESRAEFKVGESVHLINSLNNYAADNIWNLGDGCRSTLELCPDPVRCDCYVTGVNVNNSCESSGDSIHHVYNKPGIYKVTLGVVDYDPIVSSCPILKTDSVNVTILGEGAENLSWLVPVINLILF